MCSSSVSAFRKHEYVGDSYQQIYEWRGAVNAMEKVPSRRTTLLSQSFRFGPEIAAAASIVLRKLGAKHPLRGLPTIASHIARVKPEVILARSNAGVIANVLACLRCGIRCAVLGGTQELGAASRGCPAYQPRSACPGPGFAGFSHLERGDGSKCAARRRASPRPVNLVQGHGEDRMLAALGKCERQEQTAEVLCATAHRAKGRERNYMRLDGNFEASFLLASNWSCSGPRSESACRLNCTRTVLRTLALAICIRAVELYSALGMAGSSSAQQHRFLQETEPTNQQRSLAAPLRSEHHS